MDDMDAVGALQATLDAQKEEYSLLKVKFHEMQKGFLLGQLQDEMKEILLGELEEVRTYFVFLFVSCRLRFVLPSTGQKILSGQRLIMLRACCWCGHV